MRLRILFFLLCIGAMPAAAQADVKMHALCSDGMVLQQKSKAKVWGTAKTGETVTVNFRGKSGTAVANAAGHFIVEIATGDAGGPFEMTIAGKNTINYKNVLVGEVWVCSGQSNMEWSVNGCDKTDKEFATSAPHNPMLRTFNVTRNPQLSPQTETEGPTKKTPNNGRWMDAEPTTVGGFSAAAYFFGRNLQENMKVPVGLIHSSWGGTRIEAWMSDAALTPWEKQGAVAGPNTASNLYNGMIHPILNYQVKGAIWYQGESNANQAYKYRSLHPAMIENWRADFKNPNLAFYFVQLAPFTRVAKTPGDSTWAELREAQTMTLKLKNTGMAVITDFGNEYDIHPTPKRPVGERLALAARAQTYGEKIVYSGPMYKSVKFDGNKAVLSFDHVGGGLVTKEMVPTMERKNKTGASDGFAWRARNDVTNAPLIGFTVCGKDMKFHEATAEIVGGTVVVASAAVAEPMAVRYGWANHPICNLFNREGLPASPFRTDGFRGVTQPK